MTDGKAGGKVAAHAGRKTVMVRDFDVTRNVLLTIHSGSSGTPGFLTEEETRRKVERLRESVQARKIGRAHV